MVCSVGITVGRAGYLGLKKLSRIKDLSMLFQDVTCILIIVTSLAPSLVASNEGSGAPVQILNDKLPINKVGKEWHYNADGI
jgi:hypothetical protein